MRVYIVRWENRFNAAARVPFKSDLERRQFIQAQRLELLARFDHLRATLTIAAACQQLRISVPTVWRWRQAMTKGGSGALLPAPRNPGPPSVVAKLGLGSEVLELIQEHRQSGSAREALLKAANDPRCPVAASLALKAYAESSRDLPASLAKAA